MMQDKTSYLGNQNLKRSGVALGWDAEKIQEYKKCSTDPIYFIKTYIKIVNIDSGLVPFGIWPFQEKMIEVAMNNRFVICKMPRQVGKCDIYNTLVKIKTRIWDSSIKNYKYIIEQIKMGDLYELSKMQDVRTRDEGFDVPSQLETSNKSYQIQRITSWSSNPLQSSLQASIRQNNWFEESCLSTWRKTFSVFKELPQRRYIETNSKQSHQNQDRFGSRFYSDALLAEEGRWESRTSRDSSERSTSNIYSGKMYSETWRNDGFGNLVEAPTELATDFNFQESRRNSGDKQKKESKDWKDFKGRTPIDRSFKNSFSNKDTIEIESQSDLSLLLRHSSREQNNRIQWRFLARQSEEIQSRSVRKTTTDSETCIGNMEKRRAQKDSSYESWLRDSNHMGIRLQEVSGTNHSALSKLSDTIERKFIDSVNLSDTEIWTDTGWQPASVIHKTVEYIEWELVTSSHNLTCADTHIVFREDGSEVYVQDLISGDVILTESGPEKVVSVTETDRSSNMYDITVDSKDHRFYTNGILSHNTTTIAALLLWYVLFNDTYKIAILANKEKQSREILSRIQLAFEHLPRWLQQGVVEWNKGNIELENGSKILASSTSSTAIRGDSFNCIYLDEFAFVPNNIQEDFFASVYPTISSGSTSKVLITSTPNGMNMFYKLWSDSEQGRNRYERVSVHWSDVPGRTPKWRQETIDNTSERQFSAEFECEFLGSSNTLIDGKVLQRLTYIEPIHRSNNVDMYHQPQKNHRYVIVVDTSRGVDIDYSAFIVFDVTAVPYVIVCKFKANDISPLVYPNIIAQVGYMYNEAFILVETNDIGQQVADILHQDLEYPAVLITQSKGRAGQKLSGGFGGKSRPQFGVRTTKQVKRIGCGNFKSLVENNKLIINDFDLLYEMARFIENKASYEAEEGEHDDLVMCCVLFGWLSNQPYFKDISETDVRNSLIESSGSLLDDDMTPFGWQDDGTDDGNDEFSDSNNLFMMN